MCPTRSFEKKRRRNEKEHERRKNGGVWMRFGDGMGVEGDKRRVEGMPSDFARFNQFTTIVLSVFLAFRLSRIDRRHLATSLHRKDRCNRSNYLERSLPVISLCVLPARYLLHCPVTMDARKRPDITRGKIYTIRGRIHR